ncbi:methionine adenosyltransferase [Streptomyces sp. MS1.AVA.3]|uniref:methionine adenosyltransferase n=1 Tax=Streptomyces decoyicus TaxID=249567 RepID=UPI0030C5E29D
MNRTSTTFDGSHLVIETGAPQPDATTIVERKGLGHPDTLADHLAERLSQIYSQYTASRFGAVLHHNFDKLALSRRSKRSPVWIGESDLACAGSGQRASRQRVRR